MRCKFQLIFIILFCNLVSAQSINYSVVTIPENLKENANSIIRYQSINITINSQKSFVENTTKVITVLNSKGIANIDAKEYYGDSDKVNAIEATIYNAFGNEIKKIKRKDFKDQSISDGFSISNERVLFLDYTPTDYPFTVVFTSETKSPNTAFIPGWSPIDDYLESVQKSEFTIQYPPDLGFKYKEYNFAGRTINKIEKEGVITFSVENLVAEKQEEYSPSPSKFWPEVKFGLEKFYLEGVEGSAKTWKEYGAWVYNALLSGTEELSDETKIKIKALVGTETDPLKKAKIVYQFMQDKTRYVSIQLGIGGWKPMLAKDVDRLGYGDCKALSNYTRALLKTVGVDAYYVLIFGSNSKRDFKQDFVAMQGNHAVLTLPTKDNNLFLECTSQTLPFGFQGDFTDDRFALKVTSDGGEIIKTNEYNEKKSSQISKGSYAIDLDGTISGGVTIKSNGVQYDDIYALEKKSKEDIDDYYKSHFYWINNLKMNKIKFNNSKDEVEFTEDLQISALGYGKSNAGVMMVPINVFNQNASIPQRYRTRKNPFEISRGYYDEDEIEVTLPEGFKLEAKPDNLELKDKFGTYKMELVVLSPNKLLYKRSFLATKGYYEKEEYENYRKFREQIAKADNSKIVLTKI